MLCEFLWPKKKSWILFLTIGCRLLYIPFIFSWSENFFSIGIQYEYQYISCCWCSHTTISFTPLMISKEKTRKNDRKYQISKMHRIYLIVGSWFDWFVHQIRKILFIISKSHKKNRFNVTQSIWLRFILCGLR